MHTKKKRRNRSEGKEAADSSSPTFFRRRDDDYARAIKSAEFLKTLRACMFVSIHALHAERTHSLSLSLRINLAVTLSPFHPRYHSVYRLYSPRMGETN